MSVYNSKYMNVFSFPQRFYHPLIPTSFSFFKCTVKRSYCY